MWAEEVAADELVVTWEHPLLGSAKKHRIEFHSRAERSEFIGCCHASSVCTEDTVRPGHRVPGTFRACDATRSSGHKLL